jgi:large subunit ribosomal protein L6
MIQAFKGITRSFKKKIILNGRGYIYSLDQGFIVLSLGYSHKIFYRIPSLIHARAFNKTQFILKSIDFQLLCKTLFIIKSFKKVDVYKGKGLHIEGQPIILKEKKTS